MSFLEVGLKSISMIRQKVPPVTLVVVEFSEHAGDFPKVALRHTLAFNAILRQNFWGLITSVEIAKKFNWSPFCIKSYYAYVVSMFKIGSLNVP